MRGLYKRSIISILLAVVASSSLAKSSVLQGIDLMEVEYFSEAAEFELAKQRHGCSLKGIGYGEMGQNRYELYFDDNGLIKANYISYRYDKPIDEVNNDSDMFIVEEVVYGSNQKEDTEFLELFNMIKKSITAENLARCSL